MFQAIHDLLFTWAAGLSLHHAAAIYVVVAVVLCAPLIRHSRS